MRILGIDYGTKRIGLALSSESAKFAFPHGVLELRSSFDHWRKIKKICEENKVVKIVLGKPEGYKGDAREIKKQIESFKNKLEKETGLEVIYENEVLTTQEAKRLQGKIKKLDASAAAIILQSYLDKQKLIAPIC